MKYAKRPTSEVESTISSTDRVWRFFPIHTFESIICTMRQLPLLISFAPLLLMIECVRGISAIVLAVTDMLVRNQPIAWGELSTVEWSLLLLPIFVAILLACIVLRAAATLAAHHRYFCTSTKPWLLAQIRTTYADLLLTAVVGVGTVLFLQTYGAHQWEIPLQGGGYFVPNNELILNVVLVVMLQFYDAIFLPFVTGQIQIYHPNQTSPAATR